MATKKRVAPEWMAPVLAFQQRFELELTAVKRQAATCKTQAEKNARVALENCLKVIQCCDDALAEMQKILQAWPLDATQPPTPPPAKKARPTHAKGRA